MHTFLTLVLGQCTCLMCCCGATPLHSCIPEPRRVTLWLIQIKYQISFLLQKQVDWIWPHFWVPCNRGKCPHREQGTLEGLRQVLLQTEGKLQQLRHLLPAGLAAQGYGKLAGNSTVIGTAMLLEPEIIKIAGKWKALLPHDSYRYFMISHKDDFNTRCWTSMSGL